MGTTFTVVELKDGKRVETVHEASPEMQRVLDRVAKFNEENPGFWCKCDSPVTGLVEPRGHSVDVFCRCGGCLQVG